MVGTRRPFQIIEECIYYHWVVDDVSGEGKDYPPHVFDRSLDKELDMYVHELLN